jgi:glycine dehydrogenase
MSKEQPSQQPSLAELEKRDDFVRRHIGPGEPQIAAMLDSLGLKSLDELIDRGR